LGKAQTAWVKQSAENVKLLRHPGKAGGTPKGIRMSFKFRNIGQKTAFFVQHFDVFVDSKAHLGFVPCF
jgi:hypothetical protein